MHPHTQRKIEYQKKREMSKGHGEKKTREKRECEEQGQTNLSLPCPTIPNPSIQVISVGELTANDERVEEETHEAGMKVSRFH